MYIMVLLVGWLYSGCNALVPIHSIYRITATQWAWPNSV